MTDTARSRVRGAARRGRAAIDALRGVAPPSTAAPLSTEPENSSPWWTLLPFTAHRIALAPGFETRTTSVPPVDDVRLQIVVDACGGTLAGRTVVDLGCLEGGFTLAFAQFGSERALGIEARQQSVDRCELAKAFLSVDNAEFVVADIKRELVLHDPFDVVFAAGILYHVADPAELLASMRAACRHVALIDTHVARVDAATHGCSAIVSRELGGEAYRGRMFPEYPAEATAAERETMSWAAYSDVDSFWPLEDDLVRMISDAGFSRVEKVDPVAEGRQDLWSADPLNRVVYLAFV